MERLNAKSSNGRWGVGLSREYMKLSKTFEVLDATEGCSKPFYIYKFYIWKARDNSEESKLEGDATDPPTKNKTSDLSKRVRELVLTKAISSWLDENKPENSFYLVGPAHDRLLTQFAFQGSEFADDQDEERVERNSCFEQRVTIKNPQLVDAEFVPVDETYFISFSTLCPPIMDLNRGTSDREVRHAIGSMILADVEADEKFASTRSLQVYKMTDVEEDQRTINLHPYLKLILGMTITIKQFPSTRVEGETTTLLRIYESWNLFLEPVNMVQLLQEYFEFDISGPLTAHQIKRVKSELQWQTIEMRVSNEQNLDGPEVDNYVTCIKDVSLIAVADELCEFTDQRREFAPNGEITVERQFRREFPDIELEYTHLPCLISPKGRKMPIEVCWIQPGRPLERRPTPAEMRNLYQMTHDERREVFEENCRELIRDHGSTLEKFGFKLWPA